VVDISLQFRNLQSSYQSIKLTRLPLWTMNSFSNGSSSNYCKSVWVSGWSIDAVCFWHCYQQFERRKVRSTSHALKVMLHNKDVINSFWWLTSYRFYGRLRSLWPSQTKHTFLGLWFCLRFHQLAVMMSIWRLSVSVTDTRYSCGNSVRPSVHCT